MGYLLPKNGKQDQTLVLSGASTGYVPLMPETIFSLYGGMLHRSKLRATCRVVLGDLGGTWPSEQHTAHENSMMRLLPLGIEWRSNSGLMFLPRCRMPSGDMPDPAPPVAPRLSQPVRVLIHALDGRHD
ncbi:MAG: hypothetical protein H7839_22285 [Magnetococcus sp. YQC-5]